MQRQFLVAEQEGPLNEGNWIHAACLAEHPGISGHYDHPLPLYTLA